ncbi:hypothetical protein [Bradyrhizobium sp. Tv2a-2]|uniref:hypothetical protein n=1 Tax=Bradyrhizobium sp. Tv2a-2 TaxID=113395 RepID=UPI0004020ABC|nr:hypothetical protein [Bradyrhizobium sp. Tv2a-2]
MQLTESEIRLQRYKQVEREADAWGRVIGVRRLKPSEQTKAASFTADVTGYDEVTTEQGLKLAIPHRTPLMVVASVCEIDGAQIPFPRSRAELDAMYDRLDEEGLAAASRAVAKLQADALSAGDVKEEAKN